MRASEESERPGPGEAYNPGPATLPRQAASVILLRGGAEDLQVLLVKRTPHARFMGGVWVFPGGAVDAGEGDGDEAHRIAGVRELREEAAIVLDDPAALVKFSRWITPAEVQIRFDTHFFLAELPARPGAARRRRGVRRSRLVHAVRGPRRQQRGRDPTGLSDDQAPRAAARLRLRRLAHGLRARARGAAGAAAGAARRRGRAHRAARRAGVLTSPVRRHGCRGPAEDRRGRPFGAARL